MKPGDDNIVTIFMDYDIQASIVNEDGVDDEEDTEEADLLTEGDEDEDDAETEGEGF